MQLLKVWEKKRWWKGCPQLTILINCVKCAFLESMRESAVNVVSVRATKSLQLVHVDVYAPIDKPSFHKNKYCLLFIDDFSRETWVYFLKQKSTFCCFQEFQGYSWKREWLWNPSFEIEENSLQGTSITFVQLMEFVVHWLFPYRYSKM